MPCVYFHNHFHRSEHISVCVCACVRACISPRSSCQSLKLFTLCCCLGAESLPPHPPEGVSPSWRARDHAEPWGMPPEELRWTGVQLGQILLNALGWLRSDRLARRKNGGGECVCECVWRIRCREPGSISCQCRSHMTNQMEVDWCVNMRKSRKFYMVMLSKAYFIIISYCSKLYTRS